MILEHASLIDTNTGLNLIGTKLIVISAVALLWAPWEQIPANRNISLSDISYLRYFLWKLVAYLRTLEPANLETYLHARYLMGTFFLRFTYYERLQHIKSQGLIEDFIFAVYLLKPLFTRYTTKYDFVIWYTSFLSKCAAFELLRIWIKHFRSKLKLPKYFWIRILQNGDAMFFFFISILHQNVQNYKLGLMHKKTTKSSKKLHWVWTCTPPLQPTFRHKQNQECT